MSTVFSKLRTWFVKTKLAKSYSNVGSIIARYWHAYGGWGDVFASVYFHVAFVICALSYGFWTVPEWWDLVISVVPSLLGFTLGGYALLVGFLSEGFRSAISGPKTLPDGTTEESPFIKVNSAFVHYIIVQMLALLSASLAKACHGTPKHSLLAVISSILHVSDAALGQVAIALWGIGFLIFTYSMTLSAAAAFSVFRIGTWIDKYGNDGSADENGSTSAKPEATTAPPASALSTPSGVRAAATTRTSAEADEAQAELEVEAAEVEAAQARKRRRNN
ncbi:hypothetical protein [Polyangium spumosum]|uniref:Uncharacterized protein n=1 Tax=Polyangium spumosum TaxID=889282 RepID=A0A6N7Q3W2_9BACT|nr:hypothetical protein [Polyangium spumosum]MRG95591.1 hypothetical protein [Polyangium spumosum]